MGESLAIIFLSDSSILILKDFSDKIEARNCLILFQVRMTPSSYWLLYFVLVSKFLLPVPGSLQVLSPDFCNFIVCEWVCQLTWDQILRHSFSTRHLFISALEFFCFWAVYLLSFFSEKMMPRWDEDIKVFILIQRVYQNICCLSVILRNELLKKSYLIQFYNSWYSW